MRQSLPVCSVPPYKPLPPLVSSSHDAHSLQRNFSRSRSRRAVNCGSVWLFEARRVAFCKNLKLRFLFTCIADVPFSLSLFVLVVWFGCFWRGNADGTVDDSKRSSWFISNELLVWIKTVWLSQTAHGRRLLICASAAEKLPAAFESVKSVWKVCVFVRCTENETPKTAKNVCVQLESFNQRVSRWFQTVYLFSS